jgi:hypothetical protein
MTTTETGVANTEMGLNEASDTFLARFLPEEKEDAEKPSEKTDETDTEESETTEAEGDEEASDESPEAEGDDEGEQEETDKEPSKPETKKYVEDDESFVKVKVGDEELEVAVKDLKRLHGQEASLTRKGQEVAEQRKAVDAQAQQYAAGLDALMQRATAKADEFRKVNFLALTKDPNITAEQIAIIQDEARKAFEEEHFLKGELQNFVSAVQKQQGEVRSKQAQESIKALSTKDSPHYIEGWGTQVYNDIRSFAKTEGLAPDIVDSLIDAPAIKLLHMAMMYKQGAAKVATKVVNKTPKKIVKTSNSPAATSPRDAKKMKAVSRLRGSKDDMGAATDAFMATFGEDEF